MSKEPVLDLQFAAFYFYDSFGIARWGTTLFISIAQTGLGIRQALSIMG